MTMNEVELLLPIPKLTYLSLFLGFALAHLGHHLSHHSVMVHVTENSLKCVQAYIISVMFGKHQNNKVDLKAGNSMFHFFLIGRKKHL